MSLMKPYVPPARTRTGISLIIEGPEKTGKTFLGLKGKRPLDYFSIDRPPDYLLRKRHKNVSLGDYRIREMDPGIDPNKASDLAKPLWKSFVQDFMAFLTSKTTLTGVVDTASTLWDLVRLAEFGKLTQVAPVQYSRVNSQMQRLVSSSLAVDKDVLWLCRVSDEWTKATDRNGREVTEKTGKMVREGWKSLGYEAEATVRLSLTDSGVYKAKITASGYAGLGEEFEDEDITLTNIKAAILGTATED